MTVRFAAKPPISQLELLNASTNTATAATATQAPPTKQSKRIIELVGGNDIIFAASVFSGGTQKALCHFKVPQTAT